VEREEFAVAVSWLAEDDVQYWRPDLRSELGRFFGWTETDPWYRDRERLDKVHALIQERQSELFYQLKEAVDVETRQRWLDSVVKLTRPVEPASRKPDPGQPETPSQSTAAGGASQTWVRTEPARKSAFGSRAQAQGRATAATTGTGPLPTEPARRSPFGSRAQAQGQDNAATAGSGPPPTAPARKSPFGSRAQAQSRGSSPDARAGTRAAGATPTDDQLGQVAEQIHAMMSELPADELSAIARDLDLSPEEVTALMREPDFARLVAEEQARLG
jgi:hypothetical protein